MKYVSIGVLLSLLVMPVVAGADVLKVAPTQAVILPSDGSGVTRVALLFDLSDMRGGSGRKINAAHLQWSITGVSANERSEFFLHEATSAWTEAQVAAEGNIDYTEDPVVGWEIEPLDYERNGGLVKLDVKKLVQEWCETPSGNYGVVVATTDLSSLTLTNQLGNARLVVRYAFDK